MFAVFGRVTRIGPAGAGSLAKLCNQAIVGNTIAAVAEALILAKAGGADPAAVRSAILGGFADSTVLRAHGQRMLDENWLPGGPARLQLKDLRSVMAEAATCGVTLEMTRTATELYEAMVDAEDGELDHAAIYREVERRRT